MKIGFKNAKHSYKMLNITFLNKFLVQNEKLPPIISLFDSKNDLQFLQFYNFESK